MALPAQGASFDCAKAASWIEQAICEDPALGRLDERMAAAYRDAREAAQADPPALERLASEQKAWLAERDGCRLSPCIGRVYERRIAQLRGTTETHPTEPLGEQMIQESAPHLSIEAVYPVLPGRGTGGRRGQPGDPRPGGRRHRQLPWPGGGVRGGAGCRGPGLGGARLVPDARLRQPPPDRPPPRHSLHGLRVHRGGPRDAADPAPRHRPVHRPAGTARGALRKPGAIGSSGSRSAAWRSSRGVTC
jgi:hypothetical protein